MTSADSYQTRTTAWCPGCGNFGILNAVKKALSTMNIEPHRALLVGGIGQAAKLPQYLTTNGLCTLHGRALPAATGAKVANSEMTVIVHSGDGDCYAEGGNHLLHTLRRDVDITLLVHNNQIYGLTQGQGSPTSDPELITGLQPRGMINTPMRGLALALVMGCRFVARSFSGNVEHLSEMIQRGVAHRGFSFIEVLQPCISLNKRNTFAWYKDRLVDVQADSDHSPSDRAGALALAETWNEQIPIGVIYQQEGTSFEDRLPQLKAGPLVKQPPRKMETVAPLLNEFI